LHLQQGVTHLERVKKWIGIGAAALVGLGCRLPDTMTAVEHERKAAEERASEAQARASVKVQETTRPMPGAGDWQTDPTAPLIWFPTGRAGREGGLADQNEAAAKRIRNDAEAACARVPPSQQRMCPIPPLAKVERAGDAVRLFPAAPVEGEQLSNELRCAVAQARVDRPNDADACPLLVQPSSARVVQRSGRTAIEITAPDELRASEVAKRAEAMRRAAAAPPPSDRAAP
jgi:hypothetical protein